MKRSKRKTPLPPFGSYEFNVKLYGFLFQKARALPLWIKAIGLFLIISFLLPLLIGPLKQPIQNAGNAIIYNIPDFRPFFHLIWEHRLETTTIGTTLLLFILLYNKYCT